MTTNVRMRVSLGAAVAAAGFVMVSMLCGCSKKEEPTSGGGDYYTGPMTSKAGKTPAGAGGPAADTK